MRYFLISTCFLFFCFVKSNSQIIFTYHHEANALLEKAQTFIDEQNYDDAIPLIVKSMELDSSVRAAYMLLFKAGYQTEAYNVVENQLRKATLIFEKDDEIHYCLGRTYQAQKELNKAIAEFSQAIKWAKQNGEKSPSVYDYYSSRGICYLRLAKHSEALTDFDYSLTLKKENRSVLTNRGYVLYKLGKRDEACQSWLKAQELGESSVDEYLRKYCK
jgi:tetratricopeptide (TPR) repeat protein